MHRGDRSEKRHSRPKPYGRIDLPDNMRKDLARFVVNSSPLRSGQLSRRVEKFQTSQSSPVKVKTEPPESHPLFEVIDDSTSDGQLTSNEDDEMILAASSRLAHNTVPDEHKGVGVSPATNLEQPPSIQAMPEQKSTVIDKGKLPANKATTRYNYEVPPSSLSADPSSATWASRPSEGLSHGVNIQSVDLERFAAEMNNLIDEFCAHAKMKVEEFTNRGR